MLPSGLSSKVSMWFCASMVARGTPYRMTSGCFDCAPARRTRNGPDATPAAAPVATRMKPRRPMLIVRSLAR